MQKTSNKQIPSEDRSPLKRSPYRRILARFPWLQSSAFGYLACLLLTGVLIVIEKIDQYFPHAPLFVGAPFALSTLFVAIVWGMGPAVFSIGLGLLVIVTVLAPGMLPLDVTKDLLIAGPFVFLQLIAVGTVVRLQHAAQASAHRLAAANQQLRQANLQLEQAQILKEAILIRTAHELRTPLTTIRGRTQLLASRLEKQGETPESWAAVRQSLPVIEARALHLQTLIERLLDVSCAQSRVIQLQQQPCDLGALCDEVIEDQRLLSARAIAFEHPPSAVTVEADRQRLSEVLTNLISNAVKYSPEQSVIRVSLSAKETQARIHIQNECLTLPSPEQITHLFDPFYRTPDVASSSIPGWGLGLAICKEIVEQHGGHIRVETAQEKQMTFLVILPLRAGPEAGSTGGSP